METKTLEEVKAELDAQMIGEGYMPMVYGDDLDEDSVKAMTCHVCGNVGLEYQCYEHSIYRAKRAFAICSKCLTTNEF